MPTFQYANTGATVWSESTDEPVKFTPLPKKRAARLYHAARRFERQTRQPGHQDGALGRNGLKVLETLIFDFLDYSSGKLWPSIASIAKKAGISERSARRGLDNLKASGVLAWQRRKDRVVAFGQIFWFQLSNAYHIFSPPYWLGYAPPELPPVPHPSAWGAVPPLPSVIERACAGLRERLAVTPGLLAILEEDDSDPLALAMARLGRAIYNRAKP